MTKEQIQELNRKLKELDLQRREIKDQLKQEDNKELEVFEPFLYKWLHFNGYEAGSTLIYMTRVERSHNLLDLRKLTFEGVKIELHSENDDVMGISIVYDTGFLFEDLHYFTNAHDFESVCDQDEDFSQSIPYVIEFLKFGEYEQNGSRELTKEQFRETLMNHLYWNLETINEMEINNNKFNPLEEV